MDVDSIAPGLDFVHVLEEQVAEIEAGLRLGKRVIPVLVNDADMPRGEELPEPLRPLARRNAVRLTHDRFKADAQGLIKALGVAFEESVAARKAEPPQRLRVSGRLMRPSAPKTMREPKRTGSALRHRGIIAK
jgi:hypothetical protein